MNVNNKLPYEAPVADAFQLSAAPLNICIQFSGEAGFEDFEEGESSLSYSNQIRCIRST